MGRLYKDTHQLSIALTARDRLVRTDGTVRQEQHCHMLTPSHGQYWQVTSQNLMNKREAEHTRYEIE